MPFCGPNSSVSAFWGGSFHPLSFSAREPSGERQLTVVGPCELRNGNGNKKSEKGKGKIVLRQVDAFNLGMLMDSYA